MTNEEYCLGVADKLARMCVPLLRLMGEMSEEELSEALGVDVNGFSDSYWLEFSSAMKRLGASFFVQGGFIWRVD